MNVLNRNINNIFFIFALSHLIIWTLIPSLTNKNLPLDTIEALAWGSNLDWGFNKHPPMSAFFPEVFFQIFGSQDWVYYLLSQIFVIIAFYYVFKFAFEIFRDLKLSLISVLLLVSIYFYNFTTPEFNVNVCQLPFWSLVVYYSWKIYSSQEIKFSDCFLVGLFGAVGFLSKYLFLYLLISIDLLFIYLIFFKKTKKFDFKYLITIEVFLVLLVPHLIWLFNNDFITITYGLNRTGLEGSGILDHISNPVLFLSKQIGILVPFFFLIWLLAKKIKFKLNVNDKKLINMTGFVPDEDYQIELGKGRCLKEGSDITLVGMSYTTVVCQEAAVKLKEIGVDAEVIDLLSLSPLDEDIIIESVKKTNRIVIVDEDNPKASIASEVAAIVSDKAFDYLDAPVKRVTAPHTPVPYSKELENEFMPDSDDVLQTVKNILDI